MRSMALIPARLESSRIEKKPLQTLSGIPLIKVVAESVLKMDLFDSIVVATDSTEVLELFNESSIQAVMTSVDHRSGTDRINEAVTALNTDCEHVVNIQGDEPFQYREDIEKVLNALEDGYPMASLYEDLKEHDLENLNRVKVLTNQFDEAIYFSRFGIPFSRNTLNSLNSNRVGKHIGLYGYSLKFLREFCEFGAGFSEHGESLEQLRALEIGAKIKMIYTQNSYYGIDTVDDLKKVEQLYSEKLRSSSSES